MTVEIILNCSLALKQWGECAGITIPFPDFNWNLFLLIVTSAAPCIICT